MVSIDTILPRNGPVRIGNRTFSGASAIPLNFWLRMLVAMVEARMEKRRTALRLSELSDDQLRDIGLSRSQARTKMQKPAWWFHV